MEYKFRGKRKDNNQWAFGSLTIEYDGTNHINYWVSKLIDPENNYWEPVHEMAEVHPETVGMYLFIKDVKGKEVFNGDILKGYFSTGMGGKSTRHRMMAYEVKLHGRFPEHLIEMPIDYGNYRFCPSISGSQIIGNIHDNPELLNPPQGEAALHTMNNFDPGTKQPDELKKDGEEANAQESAALDTAMEATQDAEEGGVEG